LYNKAIALEKLGQYDEAKVYMNKANLHEVDTPPSATDQSITTNKNTPVNITLAGSDPNK